MNKKIIKYCLSLLSVVFHYNRKSKVLYLHDVHAGTQYAFDDRSMPIEDFLRILEAVKKEGFEIVTNITEKKNQVRLCFDDGYRGIWDCREILSKSGIFPTIFIATSLMGDKNHLTTDEIRALSDMGFPIQSHTISHKPLTIHYTRELNAELTESKEILEKTTHKQVTEICLPLGFFNENVLSCCLSVYDRVFMSVPGSYWDDLNQGLVRRILCQDASPSIIRLALLGGQNIFFQRIRKQHYHKNA